MDQGAQEVLYLPAERQSGDVNTFYQAFDNLTQNWIWTDDVVSNMIC